MGMFSWECLKCNKSILGPHSPTDRNKWMNEAVALLSGGGQLIGNYDGYGHVAGCEIGIDEAGVYHLACWLAAGKPAFTECSKSASDQGYFYDEADYELDPPLPLTELDKHPSLQKWLTKHSAKMVWTQKMDVMKFGPIQQDCWLVGDSYAMIFYWPTSYGIYLDAPPDTME